MNHRRSLSATLAPGTALLVAVAVMAVPSALAGQDMSRVSVDPRLGVAFPVGGLDEVTDFSVSGGVGLGWELHPNVAVRGDLLYSRLDAETDGFGDPVAPSLDLFTYSLGLAFDFPRPRWQDVPLTFGATVGLGATHMSGSRQRGRTVLTFDETYATVTGGGRIGLPVSSRVRAFVATEVLLIFADRQETQILTLNDPTADPFETGWVIPLTAGRRITVR
jgi:hypothetical protein